MIKRLIRSLRQKPKDVRNNIAFVFAGFFTFIVGSIWLYHFPSRFPALDEPKVVKEAPAFTGLFSNIKDQFATVNESSEDTSASENVAESSPRNDQNYREGADQWYLGEDRSEFATTTETYGIAASSTQISSSTSINFENVDNTNNFSFPTTVPSSSPRSIRIVTTSQIATTSSTTTNQ